MEKHQTAGENKQSKTKQTGDSETHQRSSLVLQSTQKVTQGI